jgi:hypothetical protein
MKTADACVSKTTKQNASIRGVACVEFLSQHKRTGGSLGHGIFSIEKQSRQKAFIQLLPSAVSIGG